MFTQDPPSCTSKTGRSPYWVDRALAYPTSSRIFPIGFSLLSHKQERVLKSPNTSVGLPAYLETHVSKSARPCSNLCHLIWGKVAAEDHLFPPLLRSSRHPPSHGKSQHNCHVMAEIGDMSKDEHHLSSEGIEWGSDKVTNPKPFPRISVRLSLARAWSDVSLTYLPGWFMANRQASETLEAPS